MIASRPQYRGDKNIVCPWHQSLLREIYSSRKPVNTRLLSQSIKREILRKKQKSADREAWRDDWERMMLRLKAGIQCTEVNLLLVIKVIWHDQRHFWTFVEKSKRFFAHIILASKKFLHKHWDTFGLNDKSPSAVVSIFLWNEIEREIDDNRANITISVGIFAVAF